MSVVTLFVLLVFLDMKTSVEIGMCYFPHSSMLSVHAFQLNVVADSFSRYSSGLELLVGTWLPSLVITSFRIQNLRITSAAQKLVAVTEVRSLPSQTHLDGVIGRRYIYLVFDEVSCSCNSHTSQCSLK